MVLPFSGSAPAGPQPVVGDREWRGVLVGHERLHSSTATDVHGAVVVPFDPEGIVVLGGQQIRSGDFHLQG